MAEVYNYYFATIEPNLASQEQPSTIEPEFYQQPTGTTFSLKAPSTSTACRYLNQLDAKTAPGLDNFPCKLLKLSSSIVEPFSAYIFKSGKLPKPMFKKGPKCDLGNYRPISVVLLIQKKFEQIIYHQLYDYPQENSLLNT